MGGLAAAGVLNGARFISKAWRGAWAALAVASLAWGAWLHSPRDPLWLGLALLATLMAQGALYRLTFARIVHRAGLHLGQIEWRLLAVWLLTFALFIVFGLLLFIVMLSAAYAVASAGVGFVPSIPATWPGAVDARGRWVLGALAAAGFAALAWAMSRVSLAAAATTARGRVQVLSTWAMTRGAVASILGATILGALAPVALWLALTWAPRLLPSRGDGLAWTFAVARGLIVCGLWLPLNAGLMAYLFQRLATTRSDPSVFP